MTTFFYPPRPENAIAPGLLKYYENLGWWAQIKKNGTCTVVSVDRESNVTFKTRHNEDHKAWAPTEAIIEYFEQFPDSIFAAELLHSKHHSVKNTMYIFDIMRLEGHDLTGSTFEFRDTLLLTLPETEHVLIAKTYVRDFSALYGGLANAIDEGLVLKNPKAKLERPTRKSANTDWMVKCRRETKNYGF